MMTYVIYDIEDDKTRARVANHCKYYGLFRLQKSVFYGKITPNRMEMISIEVKNIINADTDRVLIMPVCQSCYAKVQVHGVADPDLDLCEGERKVDFA